MISLNATQVPLQTHNSLDRKDPRYNLPVYGTIWINYGQYLRSSIPVIPGSNPAQEYSMWPTLVYNLQPLTNSDLAGGVFSIPAADNPSYYYGPGDPRNITPDASANANNIGAIIYWPNATSAGSEANRSTTPVNVPALVSLKALQPVNHMRRLRARCLHNLPFKILPAEFSGSLRLSCTTSFRAPADSPGFITRNQTPGQNPNTFLGDSSLYILDFQIRALYSNADGTVQAWMPDVGALPAGFNSSNLRYIETRIVYAILDPYSSKADRLAQIQAGQINSITKTIRVSPRTVVLSSVLSHPGEATSMGNDKGYSIVLVLLILGVISLLGSALMMMSQLDLNFTGAVKNYDKLFNLADGACGISYNDLKLSDRIDSYTGQIAWDPVAQKNTKASRIGPLYDKLPEEHIGNYKVYEVLQGYDDSARHQAGWEAGSGSGSEGYHMLDWSGEGRAFRFRSLGSLMVEVALLKHKRD